jgi:anion-transporting  ArsA/GET3 family ATPase
MVLKMGPGKMITQIEIFCGTGGVGKTTLSCSRAIYHVARGKNVLLMTIDPSLRLKELVGINEVGEICPVNLESLPSQGKLSALLLDPEKSITRKIERQNISSDILKHPFLKQLFSKEGGMFEIMGLIEVQQNLELGLYDVIVLDTAPGAHFVDFLKSIKKIENFFQNKMIKAVTGIKSSGKFSLVNIGSGLFSQGLSKILSLLKQVTGEEFLETFISALQVMMNSRELFTDALKMPEVLSDPEISKWYIVCTSSVDKLQSILPLIEEAKGLSMVTPQVLLNKCLSQKELNLETHPSEVKNLHHYFIESEERSLETLKRMDLNPETFPMAKSSNLEDQLMELVSSWESDND